MSDTGRSPGRTARAGAGGTTVRQRRGGPSSGTVVCKLFIGSTLVSFITRICSIC